MKEKIVQFKKKCAHSMNRAAAITLGTTAVVSANIAQAAPAAGSVNSEAQGITTFIREILAGDVGYLFTLGSFLLGIIGAIATQKWVVLFGGFAIGIAILIIPDALQGFFDVTAAP